MTTELARTEQLVNEGLDLLEDVSLKDPLKDPLVSRKVLLLREQIDNKLNTVVSKLLQRSNEVDAVTEKPKYGNKYRARVSLMAQRLEEMETRCEAMIVEHQLETVEESRLHEKMRAQHANEVACRERELNEQQKQENQKRLDKIHAEQRAVDETNAAVRRLDNAAKSVAGIDRTNEETAYLADRVSISGITPEDRDSVLDCVALLKQHVDEDDTNAVRELTSVWKSIVAHPESEECRVINAMNSEFRKGIASISGGREILAAAGFKLSLTEEETEEKIIQHVQYVLEEPDLATDMDRWTAWFDIQKLVLEQLEALLH